MDAKTVEQVALLARLELDPAARERYAAQLGAILEHFRALEAVDTTSVEPAVYAIDLAGRTRPDEPVPSPSRERLLGNTEHRREGFYVVPRVME